MSSFNLVDVQNPMLKGCPSILFFNHLLFAGKWELTILIVVTCVYHSIEQDIPWSTEHIEYFITYKDAGEVNLMLMLNKSNGLPFSPFF